MQIQGNKIILTTFESGNNHYYDSTFNLRPYIPPNSKGLYTVQINEFWFRNNEATLEKGDWIEFKFEYTATGSSHTEVYRCTVENDIRTYDREYGQASAIALLKDLFKDTSKFVNRYRTVDGAHQADTKCSSVISASFKYHAFSEDEDKDISGASWGEDWYIHLSLNTSGRTYSKVSMSFSNNFCYLFNKLVKEMVADTTVKGSAFFEFFGVRINGPYVYLIDTSPLQSEMRTINANSEIYNITALSYNSSQVHNSIIQGSSSMRMKTKDLTNLRIRLMNDQFDLVKIREPLYIQLTVTNDED